MNQRMKERQAPAWAQWMAGWVMAACVATAGGAADQASPEKAHDGARPVAQQETQAGWWLASTRETDLSAGLPPSLVEARQAARIRSAQEVQAEMDFRQLSQEWALSAWQTGDFREWERRFKALAKAGRTPSGRLPDVPTWGAMEAAAQALPDCEAGRLTPGQRVAALCAGVPAHSGGTPVSRQQLLGAWRAQVPESPVPDILEAIWWREAAWARRGGGYAAETSESAMQGYKLALGFAQESVDRAGRQGGSDWPAWWSLRLRQLLEGEGDLEAVLADWHRAQERFPAHPDHLRDALRAMQPRWGGSWDLLGQFVRQAPGLSSPAGVTPAAAWAYFQLYADEPSMFEAVPALHAERLAAEQARHSAYPVAMTRASWLRAACEAQDLGQAVQAARGLGPQSRWGLVFEDEQARRACHLLLMPVLKSRTPPWQPAQLVR